MKQKLSEIITIEQAMDNLAAIASINLESPSPIGLIGDNRIITDVEQIDSDEVRWLISEGDEALLNVLELSYQSVHQYLKNLFQKDRGLIDQSNEKEGVSALMSLVGESAAKMNAYLVYRFGHQVSEIEKREVFRDLQEFYATQFQKKFHGGIHGKESWTNTWQKEKKGRDFELRDFESLIKDKEYELFFIADERGEPYLSYQLLRNVKLIADFDLETGTFEEDPFRQIKAMQDRDIQASATHILDLVREEVEYFYSNKKKVFSYTLGKKLSQGIFALYLAANSKHLVQRTIGKTCSQYFHDFQMFLREALESTEYQRWTAYPPEEKESLFLIGLVHHFCFALATRRFGITEEAIGLIHRVARRGGEQQPKELNGNVKSIWSQLLFEDEKIRGFLEKFPGGPVLKTLEIIRKEQDEGTLIPFDPWFQGNNPSKLFSIKGNKRNIDVLSFGAPVRQAKISQVEIVDEFRGFLLYLKAANRSHLLINFQDRLSWQECARATSLENLQENPNYSSSLMVITLPKNTDFYHQINGYKEMDDANEFKKAFIDQINHPEENGFFFPRKWKKENLLNFAKKTINEIHQTIFSNAELLTRQMREDFIELFFQFLIVEALDQFSFDSMSFTCKDGIDTGAYASGMFFGFLTGYAGDFETKDHLDKFRFSIYWRALSIRERAPDPEPFFRTVSCLELWNRLMEEKGHFLIKAFPIKWIA